MNAKLTVKFPNNTFTFDTDWQGDYLTNAEDLANDIFFECNPQLDKAWQSGRPKMEVSLNSDPSIKSRVLFEEMASIVYPEDSLITLTGSVNDNN